MKFKVGDRVKAKGLVDCVNLKNKEGTIIRIIERDGCPIGVEFDEKFAEGHGCNGSGKKGFCRNGKRGEFELVYQKTKMEDIKKFDKKAISEAVKEIDDERLDKQKEDAKNILRGIYSKKDKAEEDKEKLGEELKDIDKELGAFTKAAK